MVASSGVFATLPANFFSPLASVNKEHYAALLTLYYRLFQESPSKLAREDLMRNFTAYIGRNRDRLADEPETDLADGESVDSTPAAEEVQDMYAVEASDRASANRLLRRLLNSGWLDEEVLPDFSRVINITPFARPFIEALVHVEEGLKTEYESHIVAIYSLLCTDAVVENGHYAVLNAHQSVMALIDSLKVLSQSIKGHYDRFSSKLMGASIKDILHLHYDLYANDILDGAYKRLKTSDNLSRYRPRIIKKVGELLADEKWMADTARKYSRIKSVSLDEGRRGMEAMLDDIRDSLRAVDPQLEDIDRRNMQYARASVERVKTLLEPDSTISGKLTRLVKEMVTSSSNKKTKNADAEFYKKFSHRLFSLRLFSPESLYRRYKRSALVLQKTEVPLDRESIENAQAELLRRLERQLGVAKITTWLDDEGGTEKLLRSSDLVHDESSYTRFIYSVLYAGGRQSFGYNLEKTESDYVALNDYSVPDLVLRRKR